MRTRSSESPLCRRCRSINLDAIFKRSHSTWLGTPVHGWQSPIDKSRMNRCPLCQLIKKTFWLSEERMRKNKSQLRSFSSGRALSQDWASIDIVMLSLDQGSFRGPPYIVSQPRGGDIIRLLKPLADFEIIKSWLEYCNAHHSKTCGSVGNLAIRSLKLIDCDTNTLVAANEMPYVILSYLWGDEQTIELPVNNSLPLTMPQTIKDAIKTTKLLGFRYLWIDRYCIDQTCQGEVAEQVHKMDLIYNHAEVAIIAAAGHNPHYGLPGITPRNVMQPSATIGSHFLVSSLMDPRIRIFSSAWNKRGWTYQEGLLSRRRLVFTLDQVYFECCGMYCCESLNFPLSARHTQDKSRFRASFCNGVDLGAFPRQLGRTPWEVVPRIEEYSEKTLTNSSDLLNGISGILRALRQSPQGLQHYRAVPVLPRPPRVIEVKPSYAQMVRDIYDAYKWSPTIGFCAGLCWDV